MGWDDCSLHNEISWMDGDLLSNMSLGIKSNKVDKKGVVMVGICYRPPNQEEEVDWKNSYDFWFS